MTPRMPPNVFAPSSGTWPPDSERSSPTARPWRSPPARSWRDCKENRPTARSRKRRLRAAQLANLLRYLGQAEQRMGQARSQLRQQQGERAFRRVSAALTELKRLRDQLRHPVEVLNVLLSDGAELAALTSWRGTSRWRARGRGRQATSGVADARVLGGVAAVRTDRTAELQGQLESGLQSETKQPAGPPTAQQQAAKAETERLFGSIRQALPFLQQATDAFTAAGSKLAADDVPAAHSQQLTALAALAQAQERFLDLRGLIEKTYAVEAQVAALLNPTEEQSLPPLAELAPAARRGQEGNLERCQRLAEMIRARLQELPAGAEKPPAAPAGEGRRVGRRREAAIGSRPGVSRERPRGYDVGPSGSGEAGRKLARRAGRWEPVHEPAGRPSVGRFGGVGDPRRARRKLARRAGDGIPEAGDGIRGEAGDGICCEAGGIRRGTSDRGSRRRRRMPRPRSPRTLTGPAQVAQTLEHLQNLRRLFFSIVEHLRETTERQAQLNDETEEAAALAKPDQKPLAAGPLAHAAREPPSHGRNDRPDAERAVPAATRRGQPTDRRSETAATGTGIDAADNRATAEGRRTRSRRNGRHGQGGRILCRPTLSSGNRLAKTRMPP